MLFVEDNRFGDVDVAHAIAVGHAKSIVALNVLSDFLQSSTSPGIVPCIDQCDPPRLGYTLMDLHAVLSHVESDVRHVQEIVREIFLDQISLVSAAHNKIINTVLR